MIVRARRRRVVAVDAEAPRHAEMRQPDLAGVEVISGYLPRRSMPSTAGRAAARRRAGSGKRRSGRRCSTSTSRLPTSTGTRPRRTVSTSGSSGMAAS